MVAWAPGRAVTAGGFARLVAGAHIVADRPTATPSSRVGPTGSIATVTDRRTVSVTASASVSAAPDLAVIALGVDVTRPALADATAAARAGAARVFASLGELGIAPADLQTSSLSIHPVDDYRDGVPVRRGYGVRHTVSVRVREIDRVDAVIAAAVAGAGDDVTLDGVQFALADPLPVEDRARELACADAARTAAHLARLHGASLGPLRSVSDGAGSSPMPVFARTAAYDAQVQPGSVEATVTVSVVFDLSFDDSP